MNIFETFLLNVVLLVFPFLVYLIYLGSTKDVKEKNKALYYFFTLLTTIFFITNLEKNIMLSIISLNFLLILSYIEDKYKIGIILSIILFIINFNKINNLYFILYLFIAIIYLFKRILKISNNIFLILINFVSIIIFLVIARDIKEFAYISFYYLFIIYIAKIIYDTSKKMLNINMTLKELESEKQIRLSLFKITHEIKNPIAVCKGYLDMIDVKNQNQVERYVPILKSEIDRLLSLLQDFLSINKCNLDIDIMDINMLVEETCDKLKPLLEDNNINLNLDLIDDDIYIKGDYNRLGQVLINIIKNSIEAIDKKGVITISSKIKNNKYYLEIKDNGCGMDADVLNKIKEPFFTTKQRGSGLGCALVHEIIEAHNAKIKYSSKLNEGTKVNLSFYIYE